MFELLPVTLAALERLCEEGDTDDVKHATALLTRFGGPEGYDRTVSAAVVGDAMLVMQEFINVSQSTTDDVVLSGTQSDLCKSRLRTLLQDGAIWLPEAGGTLTHRALEAIRGKTVFAGQGKRRNPVFLG